MLFLSFFPFSLFPSPSKQDNSALFLPTFTKGVPWESRHRHRCRVGGCVDDSGVCQQATPSGASGEKRPTTSAAKKKKKEELTPKAEQLWAMQLRHQSPVRDFIRKLKASVTMRGPL